MSDKTEQHKYIQPSGTEEAFLEFLAQVVFKVYNHPVIDKLQMKNLKEALESGMSEEDAMEKYTLPFGEMIEKEHGLDKEKLAVVVRLIVEITSSEILNHFNQTHENAPTIN